MKWMKWIGRSAIHDIAASMLVYSKNLGLEYLRFPFGCHGRLKPFTALLRWIYRHPGQALFGACASDLIQGILRYPQQIETP